MTFNDMYGDFIISINVKINSLLLAWSTRVICYTEWCNKAYLWTDIILNIQLNVQFMYLITNLRICKSFILPFSLEISKLIAMF